MNVLDRAGNDGEVNEGIHTTQPLKGRAMTFGLLCCTTLVATGCGEGLIGGPSSAGGELVQGPHSGEFQGIEPGGGAGVGGLSAPTRFACDPAADAIPAAPLRRLTRRQYERSVRDWLTMILGDRGAANDVMGGKLSPLPVDLTTASTADLEGSLRRLDQSVADPHVRAWFNVASDVAADLSQPEYLERVFGSCATDGNPGNDAACVDDFVRTYGSRLLRMPLDDEAVSFYRGFYGNTNAATDPRGFADVIAGLMNAPQFLYVVEHGQDPAGEEAGTQPLDAFELAARLSLHFWDGLPDDRLWAAAEDGSLLDEAVYEAEVERLFNHRKTEETIREFYRDWLKLEELPDLSLSNGFAVFRAFAGDDLPSPELHHHMVDEVLDSLDYVTWSLTAGIEELFLDEHSFARTEDLAAIYGAPVWDGVGDPPEFGDSERVGLLTRAALLSTGSANTRPIMKGVFIRRALLCDVIPPPPNNANAGIPELSEDLSTREVVEGLTEVQGTSCPGCHQTYINPLGFPTEMFDSLGRFRAQQILYDENGNEIGTARVDTVTSPQVNLADMEEVMGPHGLARKIVESGKVEACLSRTYFRFSMGRQEDLNADGCALEGLRSALVESGSIAAMLREMALQPTFKRRTFGS